MAFQQQSVQFTLFHPNPSGCTLLIPSAYIKERKCCFLFKDYNQLDPSLTTYDSVKQTYWTVYQNSTVIQMREKWSGWVFCDEQIFMYYLQNTLNKH